MALAPDRYLEQTVLRQMLTSMLESVCTDRPDSLRSYLFGFLKAKYPTEAAAVPGLEEKMAELGPWASRADVARTQAELVAYLDAIRVRHILEVILEAALREQPKNVVAFVMHRIYLTTAAGEPPAVVPPSMIPPAVRDALPAPDDSGGDDAAAAGPPREKSAAAEVGLAEHAPPAPEASADDLLPPESSDIAPADSAMPTEPAAPPAAESAPSATASEQDAPRAVEPDAPLTEAGAEEAEPDAAAPGALEPEVVAVAEAEPGPEAEGASAAEPEAAAAKVELPAEVSADTAAVSTGAGLGEQSVVRESGAETLSAASGAAARLFTAVADGDAAQVEAALSAGAPVTSTNASGQTALHLAAEGEPAVVAVLLATEGCPLGALDVDDRTAVMLAIAYQDGDSMARLVAAGASVDASDAAGRSTAEYAEATADAAIIKAVTGRDVPAAEHVPPPPGSRSMSKRPSFTSGRLDPASIHRASIPVVQKSDEAQSRIRAAVGENFLFQELDEETLQAVVMAMGERSVAEGEAVVTQGEASSCFYVVESGSLSIYKYDQEADPTPEGPGAKVQDVSETDSFGEAALMYAPTSDVTVFATADANLWTLERDTFRALQLSAAVQKEEEVVEVTGEKEEEEEDPVRVASDAAYTA